MKKKYIFSINFGLSTAFAFVVIITSLCITAILFINMSTVMRQDLNKRINDILLIGLTKVDAGKHAQLTKPEQENGAVYNSIKKSLQEIRNGSTDARYVYTLRQISNQNYQFIVDAEEDSSNISHLGDEYTGINLEDFIKSTNLVFVSKTFETDKWGTWLTGYSKLITSAGKLDGFLCLDISARSVIERERKVLGNILLIEILIVLFFSGLGVYIARRIAKPLSLLEKDMLCIKDFNLEAHLDIKSRFIEIMNMKNAEDNMKIGLQSFKKYVPADLVSQLVRLNKEAKLEGEKKDLTVLFSDIVNFTMISEKISLEQLSETMAEYFEGMTRIILKHKGTVDKYIGDSVMAFWGAPSELEDHAGHACLAALECQEFLVQLNAGFKRAGRPELLTRIGINSGEMIVGNFGYRDRFNYTVIGDNVNLASRLEGINKLYGTGIIISESTHNKIKDRFACRKIDIVAVKGKKIGVPIYELVTSIEKLSEKQKVFLDWFLKGINLYLEQNWKQAIKALEKALEIIPGDVPSEIIVKRCHEFVKKPPADDWQGIIVLREK